MYWCCVQQVTMVLNRTTMVKDSKLGNGCRKKWHSVTNRFQHPDSGCTQQVLECMPIPWFKTIDSFCGSVDRDHIFAPMAESDSDDVREMPLSASIRVPVPHHIWEEMFGLGEPHHSYFWGNDDMIWKIESNHDFTFGKILTWHEKLNLIMISLSTSIQQTKDFNLGSLLAEGNQGANVVSPVPKASAKPPASAQRNEPAQSSGVLVTLHQIIFGWFFSDAIKHKKHKAVTPDTANSLPEKYLPEKCTVRCNFTCTG